MQVHHDLNQLPSFNKSVITIGSFDGVHIGHQKLIQRICELAKETGGESIVITFDPHPRQIIYPKDNSLQLLTSLSEKLERFEALNIDHVVVVPFSVEFAQQEPQEYIEHFLIKHFSPAYIVIGYDHRFGLNRKGDVDFMRSYEAEHGFQTIQIQEEEIQEITISSTKIRKAILNNEIELANTYLNYPYRISGKVVYGKQIGQRIGYKTANLEVDTPFKLIPDSGIYAVHVYVDDQKYSGMLYIGYKPTVNNEHRQTIEVNIFDFNTEIYGDEIRVDLIDYIRGEEKFDSLTALKTQIADDESKARHILENKPFVVQGKNDTALAILNYNGEEMLESYLPSTLHSSAYPVDFVLIDNNSKDNSVPFMQEWHPEYKLLQFTDNYGYAGGYNKGLEQLDNEFIVLLNSDIRCTTHWLDPIMEEMRADNSIAAISPKIRSIEEPDHFEYAGAAGGFIDFLAYPFCRGRLFTTIEKDEEQYQDSREIFWASGAAMVIRKSVFDQLGGFDASFFAHQEEIDLCWRFKRAGYKIKVQPKSIVYHLGGGTLSYESPNKTYLNFRNNLIMLIKNDESGFWFVKFLVRLILDGIAGIQMLLQGNHKNTWAVVRAHWYILPRFFQFVKKRNSIKTLIKKHAIAPSNTTGILNKSIVYQYFVNGIKHFSQLPKNA